MDQSIGLTPQQEQFVNHPDREVVFGSGIGAGKTFALLYAAVKECETYPGTFALVLHKNYQVVKIVLVNQLQRMYPDYEVKRRGSFYSIDIGNGSYVLLSGESTNSLMESLRGMQLGFLGIDEAQEVHKDTFYAAKNRLVQGRKLVRVTATNPEYSHWCRNLTLVKGNALDNPHISKDYIEALKAFYPDHFQWQKLTEGGWA